MEALQILVKNMEKKDIRKQVFAQRAKTSEAFCAAAEFSDCRENFCTAAVSGCFLYLCVYGLQQRSINQTDH